MKSASYLFKIYGLVKSRTVQKIGRFFFIILKLYKAENFTEIKNQLIFCTKKKAVGVDLMKLEFPSVTVEQLKAAPSLCCWSSDLRRKRRRLHPGDPRGFVVTHLLALKRVPRLWEASTLQWGAVGGDQLLNVPPPWAASMMAIITLPEQGISMCWC